ncbi:MAG: hypothetical protein HY471_01530 [Candidatus Sungbacteria bacterium]|nr:hypothetical protein [Candidatus Sungbacteria bacterium]
MFYRFWFSVTIAVTAHVPHTERSPVMLAFVLSSHPLTMVIADYFMMAWFLAAIYWVVFPTDPARPGPLEALLFWPYFPLKMFFAGPVTFWLSIIIWGVAVADISFLIPGWLHWGARLLGCIAGTVIVGLLGNLVDRYGDRLGRAFSWRRVVSRSDPGRW